MAKRICSVGGCDSTVRARDWCGMHYARWARTGNAESATRPYIKGNTATCSIDGCARPVGKRGARGLCPLHYGRRRTAIADKCSIDGCTKAALSRGLCPMHYQRLLHRGDVGSAEMERLCHIGMTCEVEGCGQPRRKDAWCNSHYSQWTHYGEVRPFIYKWKEPGPCLVCGNPPCRAHRTFCSNNCYQLWRTYKGNVPTEVECVLCGQSISLIGGAKRKKSTTKLCKRCRTHSKKHGISVGQLAKRDGTDCGICGDPVDMTVRLPNRMCASIDHVLARANGGTNNPENLQLAHLLCNARKSDRISA